MPSSNAQNPITTDMLAAAAALADLRFTADELELMRDGVQKQLDDYRRLRDVPLPNHVPPAIRLQPLPPSESPVAFPDVDDQPPSIAKPDQIDELAFATVTELGSLLRSRQISSVELTEMYLRRIDRYDPALKAIVTRTDELAMEQAKEADREIAAGGYRGPLHGIPWGAKDLLATHGIRTTWGSEPYRAQIPDADATVVQRLHDAGAVMIAKLTLGELAWGDVWFGGRTNCPWNIEEGSSGSSAGSGAATAAGLVGFAIGTETYGSIVSPSTRNGVTGLRPSYGRVSRHGAMALSWSMDKIGPMARSVADCALVFDAIYGPDNRDLHVVDHPFAWRSGAGLKGLRIGFLEQAFADQESPFRDQDMATLNVLRELGAELIPIALPDYPIHALNFILQAEAAAAFDDLTRSDRDDLMARQEQQAWPNVLRQARLIPAVEYIQANRVRALLMAAMNEMLREVDVYVAPSFSDNLLITNLTGQPAVVVPNGFKPDGMPTSITFTGRLYDEASVLRVAEAYQNATDFHRQYPPMDWA